MISQEVQRVQLQQLSETFTAMKVSKKRPKKPTLRKLHSALRGLLGDKKEQSDDYAQNGRIPDIATTTESLNRVVPGASQRRKIFGQEGSSGQLRKKDGVIYIMSKEEQPIPKLTDEQIMERHKKADESMKQVWSNIISKYEALEDQGDIVDLKTGEIIEDNGHLRGLSQEFIHEESATQYKSTLKDILLPSNEKEEQPEHDIWQEDDAQDDSYDTDDEPEEEEEEEDEDYVESGAKNEEIE